METSRILHLRRPNLPHSLRPPASPRTPEFPHVNTSRTLLALAVTAALLSLTACDKNKGAATTTTAAPAATGVASEPPPNETADQFVARVNAEFEAAYREQTAAQWLASTYINDDSQLVSSKANERGGSPH